MIHHSSIIAPIAHPARRTRLAVEDPLPASEAEIRALLADPDETLRRWYAQYQAAQEDPELILTAGAGPSPRQIGLLFDRWFDGCQERLRDTVCQRLRYARLGERGKQLGEVALVALVATLLNDIAAELVVDPLSTAAVLVARRQLDNLCAAEPPAAADPADTAPRPGQ